LSSQNLGPVGPVTRAEQPLVSYEQVLLSQINHCSKIDKGFGLCVDNLVSLLPSEIRVEVLNEYDSIIDLLIKCILEETKKCELKHGFLICHVWDEELQKTWNGALSRVKRERPDLYTKHGHIISDMILKLITDAYILKKIDLSIVPSKLMFSIVLDKLFEKQIIAPKTTAINIGHVEG
jgi:hypothetical protein